MRYSGVRLWLEGMLLQLYVVVALWLSLPVIASPRSGKQVYTFCAVCHGERGEGKRTVGAPRLAGMEEWYVREQLLKFQQGVRGTHPEDIAGMRMRPMARHLKTTAQVNAVATYIAALPAIKSTATLKGSWVKGEVHYKLCIACHGADGKGNAQLKAPALVGRSDWYLLTQMRNYKRGVRGNDPKRDPVGMTMRPITMTLDEQAMVDVIAYISGLH